MSRVSRPAVDTKSRRASGRRDMLFPPRPPPHRASPPWSFSRPSARSGNRTQNPFCRKGSRMLVDQLHFTLYVMFLTINCCKAMAQNLSAQRYQVCLCFNCMMIFNRRGVFCQSLSGKHGTFCFDIISTLEQSRIETLVGCSFCDTHNCFLVGSFVFFKT